MGFSSPRQDYNNIFHAFHYFFAAERHNSWYKRQVFNKYFPCANIAATYKVREASLFVYRQRPQAEIQLQCFGPICRKRNSINDFDPLKVKNIVLLLYIFQDILRLFCLESLTARHFFLLISLFLGGFPKN